MWAVPLVVAAVAAIVIAVAVRRVMAEALGLRRELDRFSELRPALLELRNDAQALRRYQLRKVERPRF